LELGASIAVPVLDVTDAGAVVAPHAATAHVAVTLPTIRPSGVISF
jgi:hypothetical protein